MGDSRADNGGGWPFEDSGHGLPNLPPEWGTVVIPDDASELDREAYLLRREIRRDARRIRGRRSIFGRRPPPGGRQTRFSRQGVRAASEPTLGVPLVIMAVAVLTTLISLFVVTWGRGAGPPTTVMTSSAGSVTNGSNVLDLVLHDEAGRPVRLGPLLPAILLEVDGCHCPALVRDVAAAAPAGVRVIAVGKTVPTIPERPENVVSLADPDDRLRDAGPITAGAHAFVVDRSGKIVLSVDGMTSADDLPPVDATRLSR